MNNLQNLCKWCQNNKSTIQPHLAYVVEMIKNPQRIAYYGWNNIDQAIENYISYFELYFVDKPKTFLTDTERQIAIKNFKQYAEKVIANDKV